MKLIDIATWPRRDAFELFSKSEYPFYSVTIPVDITNVKAVSKARGLSFYYLMIWVTTKALYQVPAFQLRIRGDQLVQLDAPKPSFTDLRQGEEQFYFVTTPWEDDAEAFCRRTKEQSRTQTVFVDLGPVSDDLIYYTCIPWFDFTAQTNEHTLDTSDTIPRLSWGKYYEENGRLMIHMCIEVNHRTVHGIDLGRYKEALDREIAALS